MNELLDWVEKSAIENLKGHHASADNLAKDSATTLTIFLAAAGGGLAYAVKRAEQHSFDWLFFGATGFSAWFAGLSLLLVWKCLRVREVPSIYNEPDQLNRPYYEVEALKNAEIKGLQRRINAAALSNGEVARWLNGLRICAAASPLVYVTAAGLGHLTAAAVAASAPPCLVEVRGISAWDRQPQVPALHTESPYSLPRSRLLETGP